MDPGVGSNHSLYFGVLRFQEGLVIMEKPDQKYLSAFREIKKNINSTVSFQEILNLIVEKVTCFLDVKGASMLKMRKISAE